MLRITLKALDQEGNERELVSILDFKDVDRYMGHTDEVDLSSPNPGLVMILSMKYEWT